MSQGAPRQQPGADRLPDVAANPVVANGDWGPCDGPEAIELVAAAFRLGFGPGKEAALAPGFLINLSRGDGHDFATPCGGKPMARAGASNASAVSIAASRWASAPRMSGQSANRHRKEGFTQIRPQMHAEYADAARLNGLSGR